ncbi:hypothetical protein [Haloprofundus halobius]|uniref:hypothetical protein n=1 Tax=Haloprofundus halobius TaxID=2876194 RepID=UPI001CCC570C|nr:hypothetical protein [Haloprofundus halobius]
MADLDSCYFCGQFGDGLTELAVVPPRFDPTDEQQRTVVLCTNCRQKLGTVLEPIVDVLGDEASNAPTTGSTTRSAPPRSPSAPSDVDSPSSPPSPPESSPASPAPAPDPSDSVTADGSSGASDETDSETADAVPSPGDAIDTAGFDDPLASDAGDVTIGSTPADDPDAFPRPEDDDVETEPEDDDAETNSNVVERPGTPGEKPAEFRTVMRLLSNREFPVDRTEIESLASGAYDLDDSQARAIIDYAVEHGVLAERDGQLHRN